MRITDFLDKRELYRALPLAGNSTSASFPSRVPTATKPVTVAATSFVLDELQSNTLKCLPFGIGADGTTFGVRFIGWRMLRNPPGQTVPLIWIPYVICELSCTISTPQLGVATSPMLDTEFLCDAISVTTGAGNVVVPAVPADTAAVAFVDVSGYQIIEATFDMTGATSGNFIYER